MSVNQLLIQQGIQVLHEHADTLRQVVLAIIPELAAAIVIWRGTVFYRRTKRSHRVNFTSVFATYLPVLCVPIATELRDEKGSGGNEFYKGSQLKAFIENSTERDFSISRLWLIVDEVSLLDRRELVLLGHAYGDRFRLYVLNNGSADIENLTVSIQGDIDSETGKEYLNTEQMARLFCCREQELRFTIPELRSGAIDRLGDFDIDLKALIELSKGRNWIYVTAEIQYDDCVQNKLPYVASVYFIEEENRIDVTYAEGGGSDVERYQVEIHAADDFPQEKLLPSDFSIGANSGMQLQVTAYVDQSSTIQYHFGIQVAGGRRVDSEKQIVNIQVPIYVTDGGTYDTLREWLDEFDYVHYRLNQNPARESEVRYQIPHGVNIERN